VGFGEINEDQDQFEEGDNRSNFLGNFKSHLLYYWHLADTFDILKNVCCVLSPGVTATCNGVPSTDGTDRKRKGTNDTERIFQEQITGSLGALGKASLMGEMRSARSTIVECKINRIKAQTAEEKEVWKIAQDQAAETVERLKIMIEELE
jgi:hypothetical protein